MATINERDSVKMLIAMIFPGDFFLTRSQQAMAKQLIMKITQPTMQNIIAEPVCAHLWLKSLKYDDKGMLFKWSTDEIITCNIIGKMEPESPLP